MLTRFGSRDQRHYAERVYVRSFHETVTAKQSTHFENITRKNVG
jgi:hypothetical protein